MSDRPPERVVTELLADRTSRQPGNTALHTQGETLNYKALDARSNQLAHQLRELGVGRDFPVALCLKRSPAYVVAALGILKAGGAYLPLDVSYPVAGIEELLHEARVKILLAEDAIAAQISSPEIDAIGWGAERNNLARFPASDLPHHPLPEDLAYIIYTSGSSGRPKGVEITHGNLLHLIRWHCREFGVTACDRATQLAGLGFDAAVWEIWPNLAAGAALHFVPDALTVDPEGLRRWLIENRITVSFVPTALAGYLMRFEWPADGALRTLLIGGEALHHQPPPGLPFRCVNNYGPTECTVVATSGDLSQAGGPDAIPSIGAPIADTRIYILDDEVKPVRPGHVGEIYIGGPGVARGYRLRPDLTAALFIPDPFAPTAPLQQSAPDNPRMYRTGDLGRLLPDRQIEFVGRIDDQLKILGRRIEPDQIARVIERHPGVHEAIVAALRDALDNPGLAAYVVFRPGAAVSESDLRELIAAHLPAHMMPTVFVRLESLPLTSHGKIDRQHLPKPAPDNQLRGSFAAVNRAAKPPRSLVEERLAAILRILFNVDQIEPSADFFMLGGHSLLGAQLIARIREAFGVNLSLKVLFDASTLAQLACEIERLMPVTPHAMNEAQAPCNSGATTQDFLRHRSDVWTPATK